MNSILLNDDLTYDGSSNVISFYEQYALIANGIRPAPPETRLCAHYAARFPAQEYKAILSTCDATPMHKSFQA